MWQAEALEVAWAIRGARFPGPVANLSLLLPRGESEGLGEETEQRSLD